jgi:nitrilase
MTLPLTSPTPRPETVNAAVVQMVSTPNVAENLARAEYWVGEAAQAGAELVVLPEYFPLMGLADQDKVAVREPFGSGVIQAAMADWAQRFGVWLVGGTLPLAAPVANKVFNASLVFAPSGECVARYDKIHLFGFSGLGERYNEADSIVAGTQPVALETPLGRLGLAVCYDLRFPELFRALGVPDIVAVPAAFTALTGEAHWLPLLQARAIENQCFVLASAQGGTHASGRRTHGHSLILDPWGKVLAMLPHGEGVVQATLDFRVLNSVRSRLPALQHRVL